MAISLAGVGRALLQVLIGLLKLVFIVARWMVSAVLMLMGIMLISSLLGPWVETTTVGSGLRMVAATLVRLALAVPLAGILVLLLHPVRGPGYLLRVPLWPLRRLYRLARPARPVAPAAAPAVVAPVAPGAEMAAAVEAVPAAVATSQPRPARAPMSRRRFLIESAAVGAVMADMLLIEPNSIEVTTTNIPVRNLPERFHGFRMAQVSDLHISPYTTIADLERLVARINTLGADVVFVTGDFVDRDRRYAPATVQALRALQAPDGVYTILGNHDYYADRANDALAVAGELKRYDLGFLRNASTELRRGADKLYIMGSDDPTNFGGVGPHRRARPDLAMAATRPDAPRILLIHNPIMAPQVDALGVDVTICGHTHGGQVRVPYLTSTLVKNVEYFDQGLYQFTPGGTQFYVNRGFGTVGPPMRFRARPEISLLTLVPARSEPAQENVK